MDYIRGLDVSSVQANIDWEKVAAAGYKFAIAKCGSGNDYIDSKFAQNVAGIRAAGMTPGCYQFIEPIGLPDSPGHINRTAIEQAKYHFGACKGLGTANGDLKTFMDCEWPMTPQDWATYACSANQIRDYILAYKQQYETESGASVGIYTDKGFWDLIHGEQFDGLLSCDFWAADPLPEGHAFPVDGMSPPLYTPFHSWSVWQWSWTQIVPSIVDKVDGDCIPDEAIFTALTTR
jgi:lysozyme